jgi:hypothetical protein
MSTAWFNRWILEHQTTILRDVPTSADPYGGRTVTADAPTITAVACFLVTKSGREAVAPDRVVVVEQVELLLPLDADIRKTDRVGDVVNKAGVTLLAGPMNVLDVLPHHDHLAAQIGRVGA